MNIWRIFIYYWGLGNSVETTINQRSEEYLHKKEECNVQKPVWRASIPLLLFDVGFLKMNERSHKKKKKLNFLYHL